MILPTVVFALAAGASVAAGGVMRRLSPAIGAVVPPRADRWHDQATPTMGGVGIAVAAFAAFAAAVSGVDLQAVADVWVPVLAAAAAMFVVGVLDDRIQLSPVAKLVGSLIVGAFLVFALGQSRLGALPLVDTMLAIVWFAGVCHALNLLDNMDGLATGVALVAAVAMAVLWWEVLGPLALFAVAMAGALLGFLHWNRNRARLFMGDCGSLFLGAGLGGMSLVPIFGDGSVMDTSALMAVLVLAVPLFDTAFVLVLRRLAGRPATRGGTDHVSHRLASLGFSERSAVRVLYVLGITGAIVAWGVRDGSLDVMLPVVAFFAVLVALLGVYLSRVAAYDADFQALEQSAFAPLLRDLTFRWHAAEVLLDLVLISACYYFAYWLRFPEDQLVSFLPSFGASLPAVVGLKLASLYVSGLYRRSWQTFGLRDLTSVLRGVGLGTLLSVWVAVYVYHLEGFSRVVFAIDALLLTVAIVATRSSFRSMSLVAAARNKRSRRVLVYGAGAFGQLLVREMRANAEWGMNPVAFIDDDGKKANRWIDGVAVRGGFDALEPAVRELSVDEIVLSSRKIADDVEQRIRDLGAKLGRPVKRLHIEIH